MLVILLATGVLNQSHAESLGGLLLAIVAAILSILPLVVIWLQLKLKEEIAELRLRGKSNSEKLDELKASRKHRATDPSGDLSSEVRRLPTKSPDSPDDGARLDEKSGHDATQAELQPDEEVSDLDRAYKSHKGAL